MGEKIALGFHATVDFELEWDKEIFLKLLSEYAIMDCEIQEDIEQNSERNMLIGALAHMKRGSGGEFTPKDNALCFAFAEKFSYRKTLGGTATRAAIAISRLGVGSELAVCSGNRLIKEKLPKNIHCFFNIKEENQTYPHVVFTYPGNERIKVNNIDFVTPRENRILYSNDVESKEMIVSQEFCRRMVDAKVFLLGCFSEVMDFDILKQRMEDIKQLLGRRNSYMKLVFEDGCYIQKEFRSYVHETMKVCHADIVSMNEDELQEYMGKRFDIMNAQKVLEAVKKCRAGIDIPVLVVHSSKWALAFGDNAENVKRGIELGICLSATHFCCGNHFKMTDFLRVSAFDTNAEGKEFCKKIKQLAGNRICALPTKNLQKIEKPTIVGLGDCFVGGFALGIAEESEYENESDV